MKTSLAIIVATLVATPAFVSADDDEPVPVKARKLADRGRELHDRGDYPRAIMAFKEAYVIAPSPALLFNLAQAYRLQGNCDDAALMYRRFIGTDPGPDARALAEGHLATVERCMYKRGLNLPPDTAMANIQVPVAPAEDPIFTDRRDTPPRKPGQLQKAIGIGVALGGAVGLVGAVYYGVKAHDAGTAVERAYAKGARWDEIRGIHERGERSERNATILGIGGGLAVATGVTLYILGRRAEQTAPVAVTPTSGGAEVSVGWRF